MNDIEQYRQDTYLLYRIASNYYEQGMSQKQIAKIENISRPHVSRLLNRAKELGIVTISVVKPKIADAETLGKQLKEIAGLDYVSIVPSSEKQFNDSKEIIRILSDHASITLEEYLSRSEVIGIGLGNTLFETTRKMSPIVMEKKVKVVPLVGVATKCHGCMQSNVLVSKLSNVLDADEVYTNIPIAIDKIEEQGELFQQRFNDLKHEWSQVDTAIIGMGSPYYSPKQDFILNEATEAYKKVILKSKNVGDILINYFRRDGSEVIVRSNFIKIAMGINDLKKIKNVLCIAGGKEKVSGLYTAIKHKYINGLITDETTAKELLQLFVRDSVKEEQL